MSLLPRVASRASSLLVIGASGALAVAAGLAFLPVGEPSAPALVVAVPAVPAPAPVAPAAPAVAPAAPAPEVHSRELMLVFRAGQATYMKLADLDEAGDEARALAMPRYGRLRLIHDDQAEAAIAPVAARHVPAAYTRWAGRKVKVDNTCEATVTSFAVVARVVGDAGYAGLERWDVAGVMAEGHAVLAAKLDGCTGRFARDAALPDVVIPQKLRDAALEAAARAALIASDASHETQRAWDEQSEGAERSAWHAGDAIATEVLRHPRTGATFVSAHGHVAGGCGERQANVWGLFRVEGRTLVPVELRQLGELDTLDALLDLDGDGELELLGKPWLGLDVILTDVRGELLDKLALPFHGCPC